LTHYCKLRRRRAFTLRWALRETDTVSSFLPPGADGADDVLLLHNDTDNYVLSTGANFACMGLTRSLLKVIHH
jgi:hypothetical protein